MGSDEFGEMINYTIFFIFILILNVLLMGFIQFSQVQTYQHQIIAEVSKDGGFTKTALNNLGVDANTGYGRGGIGSYARLDKTVTGSHWNIDQPEPYGTVVPYRLKVSIMPGIPKNTFFGGWFPDVSYGGTLQTQVRTLQDN